MKLTRQQLRKIIQEAFIAGPDGRIKKLTGDPFTGEDLEHAHADVFMGKVSSQIEEPNVKNMLGDIYGEDDIESKQQAIDLAASLSGASDKEVDDAQFDIDTALNPIFNDIKDDAYLERVDPGLLKTFLNYLHRKGELKPEVISIYDIMDGFEKRYPGFGRPTRVDLLKLGIDYHDDFFVSKVVPEKFKL